MRSRRSLPANQHWFRAEAGAANKAVFDYVAEVERRQFDTFDRFVKLEALYDPNSPAAGGAGPTETPGLVIENVIAANVDTVTASIAASEVRPRFMTDDGDWSTQRTAKRLEWYCEALGKMLTVAPACEKAFKGYLVANDV